MGFLAIFDSWFLFAIIATSLWSLIQIIDKVLIGNALKNPVALVAVLGFLGVTVIPFLAPFTRFEAILSAPMIGLQAFMGGALVQASYLYYFKALKENDSDFIGALWQLVVIFTTLIGVIFLGEYINIAQGIAIAIIVISAFLLSLDVKNIRLTLFKSRGFTDMVICCSINAIGLVFIDQVVNSFDIWTSYFCWLCGQIIFSSLIPLFHQTARRELWDFSHHKLKAFLLSLLILEFFENTALIALQKAYSLGPISLIQATISTQVIILVVLSYIAHRVKPELFTHSGFNKSYYYKTPLMLALISAVIYLQL